ncbi:hypothetical protein A2Z00_00850 [Candidatus Gottesmanbacteria bacterium RBG_13_45_10]|uniref:Transposase IS200-like domain-containing protein n=1 Tax=Candidatus Gottesmanbacteria bacterium RBG_13_45_10 TaxID=1798370 RepID=A0A1F5ZFP5_9BACT|nr:MAG: hypothetical protein A2Z00_00850 [Candidatus Gottesmanbacteria bacterium RBG_13_45_10]
MSLRKTLLATGEIYHIFNRSVQGIPIFKGKREYEMFLEAAQFYVQSNPPVRFSIYRTNRERFPINHDERLVTVICFCIMTNHFHFLLRQEADDGIKQFIQRISNSFAHYYSLKYKSYGHVFGGNFKAVRVETDEQLLYLSRYIHLNPVTAYVAENPEDYLYSSYRSFIDNGEFNFSDPSIILNHFSSKEKYKEFVLAQKDYQRTLDYIKHLLLE